MRLIDADVLKQSVNGVSTHWLNEWSTLGVLAMVDKQPTVDAVPVCRCKDCENSERSTISGRLYCLKHGKTFSENFYCKDGKRKGGDE